MPQFHGITMTPQGAMLAWSWPDGTVRTAVLVWRDGGKQGDTTTPGRWEAVPQATIDPTDLWPDEMPWRPPPRAD